MGKRAAQTPPSLHPPETVRQMNFLASSPLAPLCSGTLRNAKRSMPIKDEDEDEADMSASPTGYLLNSVRKLQFPPHLLKPAFIKESILMT